MWLLREWETLFFIEHSQGQGLATASQNRAGLEWSCIYPEHRKYSIPVQGSWWVCEGGRMHTGAFSGGPTEGKVVLQEVKATEERTLVAFFPNQSLLGFPSFLKGGGPQIYGPPNLPRLLTAAHLQ